MDLKIGTRMADDVAVLEVTGEIELSNAAQLREALLHASNVKPAGLVVDLRGVTFIDSTGIGVLVGALKRAREHSIPFILAGAQRRVRRIFEITGLLSVFSLSDTVEDAIARLSADNTQASGSHSDGAREE